MAKRVSNYQESANKQELNDRVISFLSLIVFNRKRALLHPRRFEIKSRYFRNFSLHHDLILIALESSYAFDKGRVWTHTHTRRYAVSNQCRVEFHSNAFLFLRETPSIAERPHKRKNAQSGKSIYREHATRTWTVCPNFPSAPLRQTFEYIACVSQIRYTFYIESRNQLHALSTVEISNDRPAGKLPQIGGSNTGY